jgi:hypothetical protein
MYSLEITQALNGDGPLGPLIDSVLESDTQNVHYGWTRPTRKRKALNKRKSLLQSAAERRYGKSYARLMFPRLFESWYGKGREDLEGYLGYVGSRMRIPSAYFGELGGDKC